LGGSLAAGQHGAADLGDIQPSEPRVGRLFFPGIGGYTAQAIERALGGESFFLVGTCGNIHPMREGFAKEMGEAVAKAVIEAVEASEILEPGRVEIQIKRSSCQPEILVPLIPSKLG
jgi:hypothetical protein